ncbi:nuclear transport factor 2 family protein [Pseudonocardia tropica]|uniref:Nuclear transport factor 2 family protein n=1 Tax=Pseudonocardia tropica TaxID=681289 RepID=A0ABV1K219_9PSEU
MTTTTSPDVAVVERGYAAFAGGDVPGLLALLDPHVRWTEAAGSAYPGTHIGHDEVVGGLFARLGQDWSTFAPEVDELVDLGGRVLALGRLTGVHRGTGKSMSSRFAHLFTVTDGRVTAFESINDTASALSAMT